MEPKARCNLIIIGIIIYLIAKLGFYSLTAMTKPELFKTSIIFIITVFLYIIAIVSMILNKNWSKYIILIVLGISTIRSAIYMTGLTHSFLIAAEAANILVNLGIICYLFVEAKLKGST